MRNVSISEITIRLTDQQESEALSFREKVELSRLLDSLGVSVIETGPFDGGQKDVLLIKSLAFSVKSSTIGVQVDPTDNESPAAAMAALSDAARPRLQVSLPVSTVQMEYFMHKKPAAILELISSSIAACKAQCPEVEFIACDAGRADAAFLAQAVSTAADAGATLVTLCDTAGNLLPDDIFSLVTRTREALPFRVKVGVQLSNDIFLADACALAAVQAGADEIKTSTYCSSTVSLKRTVKALWVRSDFFDVQTDVRVTELDRTVDQVKYLCQGKKSKSLGALSGVTGEGDDVVLNASAGQEDVSDMIRRLGYDISEDDTARVYDAFLRIASKNGSVSAKELDAIVASEAWQGPETYRLESYVINSGNLISATCHIRLSRDGKMLESVCVGNGPVDAAFHAIEKLVDKEYELDDFQIRSVTEGRAAMGEAIVRLRSAGKLYSGRGISTDIIGSSIRAYLNAVNKIENEEDNA